MPRLLLFCQWLLTALVCASMARAEGTYVDNQDGTISDSEHAIMWQKADDGGQRSWKEAVSYCESLELAGHTDWTLPKSSQLEGLIDLGHSPTIDPVFAVKPSYYWTATDSTSSANSAKYVNFFYGNTYTFGKDNPYYVLCVRSAKAGPGKGLAAVFTGAAETGKPLKIRFTTTISGGAEPYFYEWDFGDGSTSGAADPSHTFAKDGLYKVLLTVSDNEGAVAVATQTISLPLAELPAMPSTKEPAGKAAPPDNAGGDASNKPLPGQGGKEKAAAADEGRSSAVADQAAGGPDATTPKAGPIFSRKSAGGPRGILDVMASGQGVPFKDGALGHGLLAYTFANAVAGDGDWNKDGTITAGEVQAYLDQAIKSLSKGLQTPVFSRDGEDFPVCAAQEGSTYVLTIGIGHDLDGVALVAGQDAELVRKAVEEKCRSTKTMMLTGEHANRQDILQALERVGSMVTTNDTLIVYMGAASTQENGRVNWLVNDSSKSLPSFTGIYHDELLQFVQTLPVSHIMLLGEKN